MKVLVTGGQGVLGIKVMEVLRDHKAIPFDIKHGLDIHNTDQLVKAMQGCEVVVHLAAIPVPRKEFTIDNYLAENVIGTYEVARACELTKVRRLVFSSSTAYYGFEKAFKLSMPVGDESAPSLLSAVEPNAAYMRSFITYGVSKVCAEAILGHYGLSQTFEVVILRLSPVMSPDWEGGHLTKDKVAEAVKLAVEHKGQLWYEIFNISQSNWLDTSKAERVLGFDSE